MGSIKNSWARSEQNGRWKSTQLAIDMGKSVGIIAAVLDEIDSRRSYSQFGEDKVLRSLLPEPFGEYLEIGAGNPVRNSNTYYFYKRGWRGQLVEPILSQAKACSRKRPRDNVQNCLVGTGKIVNGLTKFWEFMPSELSTASEERAESLIKEGVLLKRVYECPTISISDLLPEVTPRDPFLLSIDIEGLDAVLINEINWLKTQPRVVCVEDADWRTKSSEISITMTKSGYTLISQHTVSSIYLHSSFQK